METFLAVLGGLVAGGLGGLTLSALGWLQSGEPFDVRKHVASILTATLTGFLTTVGLVQTDIFTNPSTPDWQLLIAYATIFGAAAGFGSMARKSAGAAATATAASEGSTKTTP